MYSLLSIVDVRTYTYKINNYVMGQKYIYIDDVIDSMFFIYRYIIFFSAQMCFVKKINWKNVNLLIPF